MAPLAIPRSIDHSWPGESNTISGLGLPSTLIDAAGTRLMELSLHHQNDPDTLLLRQRGPARDLSDVLADFSFKPDASGELALELVLQETLEEAAPGSSPAGSLTLFRQDLLFEIADPAVDLSVPTAPVTADVDTAGSQTFLEGRGLLLLEDLSFAEATAALNDSVDQAATANLRLQLQLLGYSDESLADGLLSLVDLGLIPALSGNQGDGLLLEGIAASGQTMIAAAVDPDCFRQRRGAAHGQGLGATARRRLPG